jgi:hypothetical protein
MVKEYTVLLPSTPRTVASAPIVLFTDFPVMVVHANVPNQALERTKGSSSVWAWQRLSNSNNSSVSSSTSCSSASNGDTQQSSAGVSVRLAAGLAAIAFAAGFTINRLK